MTPEVAVDLFRSALWLTAVTVAILVVPSLIAGLIVAVFQAATQINEQTLSFLPRLLVTLAAIIVMGTWLTGKLMDYARAIFERAAQLAL